MPVVPSQPMGDAGDAGTGDWVTADELAVRAGVSAERLHELALAGVLTPAADGRFRAASITAIRYAEAFLAAGTPLSAIAEASRRGLMYFDTLELLYTPVPQTTETLGAVATRLGVTTGTLEGVMTALGLPIPAAAGTLRADDIRLLELLVASWSTGRNGRQGRWLTRAAMGYGDIARRVAKLEHGLFMEAHAPERLWVVPDAEERRRISIDAATDLAAATEILTLLHARVMEQTIAEVSVEMTEAFLEHHGLLDRGEGPARPAVAFVDVSGFTALSQESGDEHAAVLALRFAELVQARVHATGGRLVKLLGDGALLLFRGADDALTAILGLYDDARAAGLPPLHAGLHSGPVIERDADVFGRTVNLAARISGQARPDTILVSEATAQELDPGRWAILPIGEVELKGIDAAVPLYRVSARAG